MEIIADHDRMTSFEIVEVNPVIDEHNRTADWARRLCSGGYVKLSGCLPTPCGACCYKNGFS